MVSPFQSYSTPIYITSQLNGCVLELKNDNNKVVISKRGLPPHDSQLWYLVDQSDDGTFLIVSKLNGKVLSCDNSKQPSKESLLWKKDGDHIMSVQRENFALRISGVIREHGYPAVLRKRQEDDRSQMFDERPAVSPCEMVTLCVNHLCILTKWYAVHVCR